MARTPHCDGKKMGNQPSISGSVWRPPDSNTRHKCNARSWYLRQKDLIKLTVINKAIFK